MNLVHKNILKGFILIILFSFITFVIYQFIPVNQHWHEIFRPAALRLFALKNPFDIEKYFNPPWALVIVFPFAVLPERLGNALFAAVSLFCFGFVAYRLGAKPLTVVAIITLPFTFYNVIQVNIDWLVALGVILPPQIGLFFVLLKPQIGFFVALFWFVDTWREKGWRTVIKVFSPVLIAFLITFMIFGNYFSKASFMILADGKNFWPYSIPVGLALLFISIQKKKRGLSLSSAIFLTPYIQPYTWPLAILGLLPNQFAVYWAVIGCWIIASIKFGWMLDLVLRNFR